MVEQDHRAVKQLTRPLLGIKPFWAARCTIAGREIMYAIRKGQLLTAEDAPQTLAEQFYALAAEITNLLHLVSRLCPARLLSQKPDQTREGQERFLH